MPLDDNQDRIRLLIISSGPSSDAIDCHLTQVSLGDEPSYEALSYTWGTLQCTSTISLNGTDFQVTPNLESALRKLRLANEDRIIWIDAICIDQANTTEKNKQVQQMRRIYQNAWRVVIWLGSEADDSNIAMAAVERMGGSFDPAIMRLEDACDVPDVPVSDPAWHALGKLFRRSWYKRIWILQEVSASANAIVVCGSQSVLWTTFCFAAAYIFYRAGRKPGPSPIRDTGYESLFSLCSFLFNRSRSEVTRRRETGLLRLLTQFRHCEATDPRDKVYALLGMASDMPDDANLKPNYAKPVAEVYRDLVEFIVTKDRNLDVLRACQISGPEHDLPSWVPDWSIASSVQALHSFASTFPGRASGNSAADVRFPEDSATLVAQGVLVDIIRKIEDPTINTFDSAPWNNFIERLTDNIINKTLDAVEAMGPATRAAMGIPTDGPSVPVSSVRHMSDSFSSNPRPMLLFCTDTQLLGTTQAGPMYDDIVCVLLGCSVPLILRRQADDVYRLVGEASIAPLMFGGVMKDVEEGRRTVREFHIV
ncbi:MAG: hypothetical protein Q9209_003075 [Squamulea sp. 1 TL-2023]